MPNTMKLTISGESGGIEVALANMDEVSRTNFARKSYEFAKRVMRNQVYRKMVEEKEKELRASGFI